MHRSGPESRAERAARLGAVERALAAKEARLAAENEAAAETGPDRHRKVHRQAALVHRAAAELHERASGFHETHETHAAHVTASEADVGVLENQSPMSRSTGPTMASP